MRVAYTIKHTPNGVIVTRDKVLRINVPVLTRDYKGVRYTVKRNEDGTWNYQIAAKATVNLSDDVHSAGDAVVQAQLAIDKMKRGK